MLGRLSACATALLALLVSPSTAGLPQCQKPYYLVVGPPYPTVTPFHGTGVILTEKLGNVRAVLRVKGWDEEGNKFSDVVAFRYFGEVQVIRTEQRKGHPGARTYFIDSSNGYVSLIISDERHYTVLITPQVCR